MPKPVIVYTANDLHGWKDFLKGLRVLLLERDNTSACEIRTKLEAMDYNGEVNFSMSSVLKFSSKEAKMFVLDLMARKFCRIPSVSMCIAESFTRAKKWVQELQKQTGVKAHRWS
ncbi:Two-component response regulator-like [Stylosanthes scabra]|uniref:Two-component response regulator-like n=1 Tax=Stylosanthes scabra TaxID=79078 RepID=A0ABU6XSW5_9FABA|nr:Two-component response regulator-like [Stylosanthes scabra]